MVRKNKHARVTEDILAQEAGKTVRTIRNHADAGTIVRGPDGLYDRELALLAIANVTTAGRPRKAGDEQVSRRIDWNERLNKERARKARIERLELQGKLVRRDVAMAAVAGKTTLIRDQLLELGPTLAGRLAAETDPNICAQLITTEVRRALTHLADVAI